MNPGRRRSGAIYACRPAIHDLTLDTAFKKMISARLESVEGKSAIGTALDDEVEAFQQPVVRHLSLELLERPAGP